MSRSSPEPTMTYYNILFLCVLSLIVARRYADANSAIAVNFPCADTSRRFDVVGLECRACPVGKVVSSSGTQCICPENTILQYDTVTKIETCSTCNSTTNLTPAANGLQCIDCGVAPASLPSGFTNPTVNNVTGICSCQTGYATVEVKEANLPMNAKLCVECPTNSWVDPSKPDICSFCPYPQERVSNACVCPSALPVVRTQGNYEYSFSSILHYYAFQSKSMKVGLLVLLFL